MPRRVDYDPQPKAPPSRKDPVQVHLRLPPVDAVVRWHQHRWGQLVCPRKGNIRVLHRGYKPGDENEYLDSIRTLVRE